MFFSFKIISVKISVDGAPAISEIPDPNSKVILLFLLELFIIVKNQ